MLPSPVYLENAGIITTQNSLYWRLFSMNFVKGMCLGLIVGAGAGMIMEMSPSKKKSGKRMVGRAMKNVGQVIEDVTDALGI
jgi:gas vesicle protein